MSATFEEIVRAWMLEYDDRLPVERRDRQEAFVILLGNLKDHGYGKEELNSSRKEKIIKSSVNPNHRYKNKLKTWINMAVNDLEGAIQIFYGTVKIRKDVVTPEMAAKLDSVQIKAEEQKALSQSKGNSEDSAEENFSIVDDTSIDVEIKKTLTESNVIETTNEMLKQMDGPEGVWDDDLIKELGIKIYE